MGILYLVLGVLIGNQLVQNHTYNKENEKKQSNPAPGNKQSEKMEEKKTFQLRKKIKKYLVINKDSPEPINPDQITVKIKKDEPYRNKSSPEPNPTVLALLWSHYKACSQGLLQKGKPAPWENLELSTRGTELEEEQSSWVGFLKELVRDKSWINWIKDPVELKSRAILAYQRIKF